MHTESNNGLFDWDSDIVHCEVVKTYNDSSDPKEFVHLQIPRSLLRKAKLHNIDLEDLLKFALEMELEEMSDGEVEVDIGF